MNAVRYGLLPGFPDGFIDQYLEEEAEEEEAPPRPPSTHTDINSTVENNIDIGDPSFGSVNVQPRGDDEEEFIRPRKRARLGTYASTASHQFMAPNSPVDYVRSQSEARRQRILGSAAERLDQVGQVRRQEPTSTSSTARLAAMRKRRFRTGAPKNPPKNP